jgi:GH43 family beta-xylosidase
MIKKTIFLLFGVFLSLPAFCQTNTYTNPISDSLFIADPFVLQYQGVYYLYGTSVGDGFKGWKSTNLVDWQPLGYVFQKQENSWGNKSFWAPEVVHYRNKFYLIYSSSGKTLFGEGLRLCMAVADQPEGPFVDLYAPLFDHGYGCIDGHLFIENDKPYLYFEMVGVVGEPWKKEGYFWGTIMGAELTDDLSALVASPTLCIYPTQEWEGLHSMHARSTEGMTVFQHGDQYYMTYSANHYADPNYGIGYATASKPLGLWTKYEGNPILQKNLEKGVSGPGHNAIVKSPDGKEWFMVYHSHADVKNPSGRRIVNIDRMIIDEEGKISVAGPTRSPQPLPSGSK